MGAEMSVRERLCGAWSGRQPDRVPCTFMIFAALRRRCPTEEAFVLRQLDERLDPVVHLGHLPMSFHPSVSTAAEKRPDGAGGFLLRKVYRTPAGDLEAVVRQTEDWPYGDEVPLLDDYLIPRSAKFPVAGRADLPALRYLFGDFAAEAVEAYRRRARELAAFAAAHDLPTAAGWGRGGQAGVMGMDAAMWLVGMENLILLAHDEPETVDELAAIIAEWNRRQLEIVLDPAPDLVVRRAWYETTEFWTPAQYGRFIQPHLAAEARLVHQAGALHGYIITSAMMPLMPAILEAGVDVIIGVDPLEGKGTDLAALKAATRGRGGAYAGAAGAGTIAPPRDGAPALTPFPSPTGRGQGEGQAALWGGVNGFLTVELGTAEEVEQAVQQAIEALAPGGGFVLSPVDNVRDDSPRAWANVRTLIAACRRLGRYA